MPRHHLRMSVSIATAAFAVTWNTGQDLPAFPAVLCEARSGRVRDADLGCPVSGVRDEVDERGLVSRLS
jgi:hypothetical protein